MAALTKEQRVVRQIIKDHGEIIDLRAEPQKFIEIVRKYAFDLSGSTAVPDAGVSPGGVGPVGPTSRQIGPGIDDVMKEVLKLQRQLTRLEKKLVQ